MFQIQILIDREIYTIADDIKEGLLVTVEGYRGGNVGNPHFDYERDVGPIRRETRTEEADTPI